MNVTQMLAMSVAMGAAAMGCGGLEEEKARQASALPCAQLGGAQALWLQADDLALSPGAAVASWLDGSGRGSHAAQATAGRRPTWQAAAIGGRAAVRFDGVDDRLDLALNTFAAASFPMTVVAVLRTSDASGHVVGTGSSAAGYLATYGSALTVQGGSATMKANSGGSGLLLAASGSIADGAARVVTSVAAPSASAIFVEGLPSGASAAATSAYAYGKSTLGASDGSSTGASQDPFAGDLAELIVYPRVLAEAERAAVEACLGERYGVAITLPKGCDGVAGSGLTIDACGVCGGDASSCLDEAVVPSGLALWLRADDLGGAAHGSIANGGAVGRWRDASVSVAGHTAGHADAIQAQASRQPTFAAAAIGGHAALRFDGVDDRLDLARNVFAAAHNQLTVLAVLESNDQVGAVEGHVAGTGSSSSGYLRTYGSALTLVAGAPTLKANSGGAGLHLSAGTPLAVGVPRLVAGTMRPAAQGSPSSLSVGCAEQGLPSAGAAAYAYGKSTLGASDGSSSGASIDPFAGKLAELIVYHRALAPAERDAIEEYLTAKYGLGSCPHTPIDPAVSLASSAAMFFRMNENGPGPRVDLASGLNVYPYATQTPPIPNASVAAVPAIVGSGQFLDGPGGYHFWRSTDALMDHGGGSFTWAGWMKLTSFYDDQVLVGKWNNGGADREYRVTLDAAAQQLRFEVSKDGTAAAGSVAAAAHPTTIALDTFYFVEAWHDAAADTLNLRVGTTSARGAVASVPWAAGVHRGGADLNIASYNTCTDDFLHGTIDALGYWRRALTEAESLRLWNDGAGFEP